MELLSTMPQLPLIYNCTAVFEAIDATTGAAVAGVVVTNPVVYGIDLSGQAADTGDAVPALAPLFVPVPVSVSDGSG